MAHIFFQGQKKNTFASRTKLSSCLSDYQKNIRTTKQVILVQSLDVKANNNQILPISLCQLSIKMDKKRQSLNGHQLDGKRSKKTVATDMYDWFVPSMSSFDCTSNQILVIGPPSNFDGISFSKFREHLEMGDTASALALTYSLNIFILKRWKHLQLK